ncbi:MAG TPA: DUF6159 family protein [Nocardioidaceae bacterium]|jgi:hypothetical protein
MATYDATWRPPEPPSSGSSVSALLVARVYRILLEDTSMVGVIAVGALVSSLAFAGIAVPAWLLGGADLFSNPFSVRTILLYLVAGWAAAFVSVLFSGAVVAAGIARLDGHPITVTAALGVAMRRWRQLAAWALVSTVVGFLAEQLNRFGILGNVLRVLADLAWALATLLVLPIIIVEGRMPTAAITESTSMVKHQLMLTVRTKVRFYLPLVVVMLLAALLTGAGLLVFIQYHHETPEWGIGGLLLAVVGFVLFVGAACVESAADALLNLVLYRHALGLPVPGVDARDLPRLPGTGEPSPPGWTTGMP